MIEGQSSRLRPLEWIRGSKKDLMALPNEVVNLCGYALYVAQAGAPRELKKAKAQD